MGTARTQRRGELVMRQVIVAAMLVMVPACGRAAEPAASPSPTVPPFYKDCDQIAQAIGYFGPDRVWYEQADQFSRQPEVEGKPLAELTAEEAWPIFKVLQERWIQCSLEIPKQVLKVIRSGDRVFGG